MKRHEKIESLGTAISDNLQELGQECVHCQPLEESGGLRCYHWWHNKLCEEKRFGQNRWEETYWEALRCKLARCGWKIETERYYPGSRNRCDLVATLELDGRFWIEGKVAYPYMAWWDDPYWKCKHLPQDRSWMMAIEVLGNSDLSKLKSLTRSDASYIGVLLLGFDRIDSPFIEELAGLLPSELKTDWVAFHRTSTGITWPDSHPNGATGFMDRMWLWYREVA